MQKSIQSLVRYAGIWESFKAIETSYILWTMTKLTMLCYSHHLGFVFRKEGSLTTPPLIEGVTNMQEDGSHSRQRRQVIFMDDDRIDVAMLLPPSRVCFPNGRFPHDPSFVRRRYLDSIIKPISISQDQMLNFIYMIKHYMTHIIVV